MRVSGIGARSDDRTERKGVGTVGEHIVLELVADFLFGQARLDELEHMGECRVGNGLGMTHQSDLLFVLDRAHTLDIAMHLRKLGTDRKVLEPALDTLIEIELHIVFDGDRTALAVSSLAGDPIGDRALVHVELPRTSGRHVLLEAVEITRICMQITGIAGDECRMGELERVIEHAHGPREPAEVRLVADDDGIVAAIGHHGANALDTPSGTVCEIRHRNAFLFCQNVPSLHQSSVRESR